MLTCESIEAMSSTDYLALSNLALELHSALVGVLDMQSPQDVGQQEDLRTAIILKLDEAQSELMKSINDLRALKKSLEIAQSYASSDRSRIKSHKIGLFIAIRDGRA